VGQFGVGNLFDETCVYGFPLDRGQDAPQPFEMIGCVLDLGDAVDVVVVEFHDGEPESLARVGLDLAAAQTVDE
jgi:hypothetical protein